MTVLTLFAARKPLPLPGKKGGVLYLLVLSALTVMLTAVFLFNPTGRNADMFHTFQYDSENLVRDYIESVADENNGLLGYTEYSSNFGLQGHIYRLISRVHHGYMLYHTLTCFALALTVTLCCSLLWRCDPLLAVAMYAGMGLSPWVVCMARNLYWVQFTWYLPLLVGLACFAEVFKKRPVLYAALLFLAVLLKSLCGYEFITTVLITAMAFPLLKLLRTLGDKSLLRTRLREFFLLCAACVLAVLLAMTIHALAMDAGGFVGGLRRIAENSKVRMAWAQSESIEQLYSDPTVAEWLNRMADATAWETVRTYLRFPTELFHWIPGTAFLPLSAASLCIAAGLAVLRKEVGPLLLYTVLLLSTLSWYVLASPHALGHTHICYVLWYMGFAQMLLYLPLKLAVCIGRGVFSRFVKHPAFCEVNQQ